MLYTYDKNPPLVSSCHIKPIITIVASFICVVFFLVIVCRLRTIRHHAIMLLNDTHALSLSSRRLYLNHKISFDCVSHDSTKQKSFIAHSILNCFKSSMVTFYITDITFINYDDLSNWTAFHYDENHGKHYWKESIENGIFFIQKELLFNKKKNIVIFNGFVCPRPNTQWTPFWTWENLINLKLIIGFWFRNGM